MIFVLKMWNLRKISLQQLEKYAISQMVGRRRLASLLVVKGLRKGQVLGYQSRVEGRLENIIGCGKIDSMKKVNNYILQYATMRNCLYGPQVTRVPYLQNVIQAWQLPRVLDQVLWNETNSAPK